MEKKILFCNIAWMERYIGKTDDDIPLNGGRYIEEVGSGGEVTNFIDDNGKCYGFVMVGGDMGLQDHFEGVKSTDEYVEDVLVVWVATNKKNETRIVGWYKDARVYRSNKESMFFTNPGNNRYYNIVADAIDCYLLPSGSRTFDIDRASEAGIGKGFGQSNIWYAESEFARDNVVPQVIDYIENYDGEYSNFVYHSEFIQKRIESIKFLNNFNKLYEEGLKEFDEKYYYDALIYFKAAQRIKEPIELLKDLGESLFHLLRNDEAIELFHRIINIEGETMESLVFLTHCYDWNGDREKTIEYGKKIIDFPGNSIEDIEEKLYTYYIIFNIHIHGKKFEDAEETIESFSNYLQNTSGYSQEDIDDEIMPMKEYLEEKIKDLSR